MHPELDAARRRLAAFRERGLSAWQQVPLIALPTMPVFPPAIEEVGQDTVAGLARYTPFANVAGIPGLALPIPSGGPLPASLQLLAPPGGEELLLATGKVVEAAAGG
jgi:Asp-tRNA(Asn)/Glu-tRNA(Gln) amidotransferase A subunit family amidase